MRPAKPINRILFQTYSYLASLADIALNLLPPPARWLLYKAMLKKMGSNVHIDYQVYMRYSWKVSIGNDVFVNRGCRFYCSYHADGGEILLGNNVRLSPHVTFFAAGHDYNNLELPDTAKPIIVHDNVWIGGSSIILQGVTIGEGVVVAAGSVVTGDLLPYHIYAGVPARKIRQRSIDDKI